ncbi:ABC transporter ATP-binding protein [Actinophytocola sp.]|uniref:ABC transporter ATP-binding protein n=1 Tax=Actinophytocola sp. TaxID=1872138 RepID=UPI002ED83507
MQPLPDLGNDARIVVSGLTKTFGRKAAVDDLSFTVDPGQVTGFLGPNGAGKTTTLRMLLGLITPSHGTATIAGRRYAELATPSRAVGAMLEATGFHPGRTGRDHLRTYAPAAGVDDHRVDEVLDLVELTDASRQKVRGYSLGMRQRLGLAGALLADPAVLICDEPANGLDPDGIRWLRDVLRTYADRGRAVLVSSHLLAEMQNIADAVVILNRGRLVESGLVSDLAHAAGESVHARCADPDALIATLPATANTQLRPPDRVEIRGVPADVVANRAATAGLTLTELRTERFDLERLYFSLTAPGRKPDSPLPDAESSGVSQ